MSEIPDFNSASVEVEDTVEVVFQLMLEQGWSDGLPVIPPTPQLVRRMIDYVRRDPGEVIGYINPD
ncbi:MAG TPA: UGSC family (seleno)protein, partial [Dehalococcoidia bacterium]|nr:UGSC family (seleno)protein [Dehalococcoidia bacterium]